VKRIDDRGEAEVKHVIEGQDVNAHELRSGGAIGQPSRSL
jgi:hypothetical protein